MVSGAEVSDSLRQGCQHHFVSGWWQRGPRKSGAGRRGEAEGDAMLAVSDQHGQGAPCADQKSGRRLTIGHEHGHADELRFAPPALSCGAAARRGRGGSVVPHSSIPFAVGLQLCVHLQFTTHPLPAAHLLSAPRARCRSCWQWRPLRAGAALAAASGRTGEPACGWLAALAQRCRCVGVLASWLPCAARWLRSDAANVARWASGI